MPWVWTRRRLAEKWHRAPWEIDDAIEQGRMDEIALELKLGSIEAEYQQRASEWQQRNR